MMPGAGGQAGGTASAGSAAHAGLQRVAWSYESPTPTFQGIAGWLAFYACPPLECWVGEERVQPQVRGGGRAALFWRAGSDWQGWRAQQLHKHRLVLAVECPCSKWVGWLGMLTPRPLADCLFSATHSHGAGGAVLRRLGDIKHCWAFQGRPRHRRLVTIPVGRLIENTPAVHVACTM